jgi:hypothetical protein
MGDVHVVPSGEGWALQVDGEARESFVSQNEAITRAGQRAWVEGGGLVVHGPDGQIREDDGVSPAG